MQIHQSKVNVKFVFLVPGNAWPQLPGLGKWKVQTESLNLLLHPCLPCIPGIGTLLLGKKFVFYGVVRIRIVQINFMYFITTNTKYVTGCIFLAAKTQLNKS